MPSKKTVRLRQPDIKKKSTFMGFGLLGKSLITLAFIGVMTAAICITVFVVYITNYINPVYDLEMESLTLNYTSTIYYTNKTTGNYEELETLYGEQNRIWADSEEIPQALKDAVVAIEDKRFYDHHGVDWKRTIAAAVNMVIPMKSDFGGSTITQQVIKNISGEKAPTVQRKIQEIMRALYVDRNYSKDDILTIYLNTIYLSQGCYGVKTAAQTYFGKELNELNIAECACLAGITNAPTYYDPFQNPENNKRRQENILEQMKEQGMISEDEYNEAVVYPLNFQREQKEEQTQQAQSYYVDQVIRDVIKALKTEKGYDSNIASQLVYSGGLSIYTCIDPEIQQIMDDVYSNPDNFPKFSTEPQPQSAMVVMDPYTGYVVGMVGGRGEKTAMSLNRATQSYRQPGSSIKPITVYSAGLEYGLNNPATVYCDSPVRVLGGNVWPVNSSRVYTGQMTVLKAITTSTNTVAVKIQEEVGTQRSIDWATNHLGISSFVTDSSAASNDLGSAQLALGGLTKGVNVLEMTAAYSSFVNEGIYTEPITFWKVCDHEGNVIIDNTPEQHTAMSKKTAYYMNYMLQNVVKSGTGTAAKLSNMPAAGKTGTTTANYDRWFMGYTPYYVGGVWFGYDYPKYLSTSGNPSTTIWKLVMSRIHENLEYKEFFSMDGFVSASYCLDSGLAPGEYCESDPRGSRVTTGLFYKDDVPKETCNLHIQVDVDSTSWRLAVPSCPAGSRSKSVLLNLQRSFGVPGIVVTDEGYCYRQYDDDGNFATADGQYPFVAKLDENGEALNSPCPIHVHGGVGIDDETDVDPDDPNSEIEGGEGTVDLPEEGGND